VLQLLLLMSMAEMLGRLAIECNELATQSECLMRCHC
jgi:hypothetical protein